MSVQYVSFGPKLGGAKPKKRPKGGARPRKKPAGGSMRPEVVVSNPYHFPDIPARKVASQPLAYIPAQPGTIKRQPRPKY